jgi:hypothetical protein
LRVGWSGRITVRSHCTGFARVTIAAAAAILHLHRFGAVTLLDAMTMSPVKCGRAGLRYITAMTKSELIAKSAAGRASLT